MRIEVAYRERHGDGRLHDVAPVVADAVPSCTLVGLIDVYLVGLGGSRATDDDGSRDADSGGVASAAVGSSLEGNDIGDVATVAAALMDPITQLGAEDLLADSPGAPAGTGGGRTRSAGTGGGGCRTSAAAGGAEAGDLAIAVESDWTHVVEVFHRPGVADPVGASAADSLRGALDAEDVAVSSGRMYVLRGDDAAVDRAASALYNGLIEEARVYRRDGYRNRIVRTQPIRPHTTSPSHLYEEIPIVDADDEHLRAISRDRVLALSDAEMSAVRDHYRLESTRALRERIGLPAEPTDVELETFAQTWSEHCKHKIFAARIDAHFEDESPFVVDGVFGTYIRAVTDELSHRRADLVSVFHDNAGIVRFDGEYDVCFKAETHNSPSALDPYGGAITGIVGVNRDILGTGLGAKPIANTNVLCFASPDTPPEAVPGTLLHPRRVLRGVHKGIEDGGNQSGIPVVAGGFCFDESYLGKPLVYCGTVGILPHEIGGVPTARKEAEPGDLAVMVGGRVGKDGIHGATFSSATLDETSPTSAVQIGDPITQRRVWDFLLEARDALLFHAVTDNGAGGLSSSLGEMAQLTNGIRVDLDRVPLKYGGLSPWEIWVSESQERMSLAVPSEHLDALLALARAHHVEATVVGRFTDDGFITLSYADTIVGVIELSMLHDGVPRMNLRARWTPAKPQPRRSGVAPGATPDRESLVHLWRSVLADPNVASKEQLVRRYDHEVQGATVGRPFVGVNLDAPSDGGVIRPVAHSYRGLAVTHGIAPRLGTDYPRTMACHAVDEALRALVCLGGDPDRAYALDNFCWPDPVASPQNPNGDRKLGALILAAQGLAETCRTYNLPLISGKDSMKNDAVVNGRRISVTPTLLISLIGIVPDVRRVVSTDFKQAGDVIYLTGVGGSEIGGSILSQHLGEALQTAPVLDADRAIETYRALHRAAQAGLVSSMHDLSDGGLAAALFESALGGSLGATIDVGAIAGVDPATPDDAALFSEHPSRILVTVHSSRCDEFERIVAGCPVSAIGRVEGGDTLSVRRDGRVVAEATIPELTCAWKARWGGLATQPSAEHRRDDVPATEERAR